MYLSVKLQILSDVCTFSFFPFIFAVGLYVLIPGKVEINSVLDTNFSLGDTSTSRQRTVNCELEQKFNFDEAISHKYVSCTYLHPLDTCLFRYCK